MFRYGSGFWVVEMTERTRMISALITPPRLSEWLRMPFLLKNCPKDLPKINWQWFIWIPKDRWNCFFSRNGSTQVNWCIYWRRTWDIPITVSTGQTILHGRHSVSATTWMYRYEKVERLLSVCDRWNLSIILPKRFGDDAISTAWASRCHSRGMNSS